jgi:uncharacterized membrane protein
MNDTEPPVFSHEPNPFWRENAQKLVGESICNIEEVAKQLIAVNSLLEGIYFHAITFSDIKPVIAGSGWFPVIYLAPIVLWFLSLIFAVLTLSPKSYEININSSRKSKERFEEIVSRKHGMLKVSELFLILSFIPLFFAVAHYLFVVP